MSQTGGELFDSDSAAVYVSGHLLSSSGKPPCMPTRLTMNG